MPPHPPTTLTLAGIPVRRVFVAWIADQLGDDPCGDRLRDALDRDVRILGLEINERETIIRALDDPAGRARGAPWGAATRGGVATARRALGPRATMRPHAANLGASTGRSSMRSTPASRRAIGLRIRSRPSPVASYRCSPSRPWRCGS